MKVLWGPEPEEVVWAPLLAVPGAILGGYEAMI